MRFVGRLLAAIALAPAGAHAQPVSFDGREFSLLKSFGQRNLQETAAGRVHGGKIYHAAAVVVDRSRTPNAIYVMDSGNSRILGFKSFGATTATLIFGQPDALSSAPNGDSYIGLLGPASRSSLCLQFFPFGTNVTEQWGFSSMDVDSSGNLCVVDRYNNRVLVYNSPFSADKSGGKGDVLPDRVIGQADYQKNRPNRGLPEGERNASGIDTSRLGPSSRGVSIDPAGNIWVADTFNFRVLRFPPGSSKADLVLGQPNFYKSYPAWGSPEDAPKNRMETPTVARINPETGELFVIDEHREGFRARIMVFKPPFKNGMLADRIIVPRQVLKGDYAGGYTWTHATGLEFNRFKTEDWIDPKTQKHRYKEGVLWVHDHNRCMLLDSAGRILLAIGAKDLISYGGKGEDYAAAGLSLDDDFNIAWPGGSMGFDSDNNIYLCDGGNHQICRYKLPYRKYPNQTIPKNNGGMFPGHRPNGIGPVNLQFDPFGVFVFGNQLIVRDKARYMVWGSYLTRQIGAPANFFPGQTDGWVIEKNGNNIYEFSTHSMDSQNRLWATGEHGRLMVWQLPMRADSLQLRKLVPLHWANDPGTEVDYECRRVVTVDPSGNRLWIFDNRHYRLLRVQIPSNINDKLLVDAVIGQSNKTNGSRNRGLTAPTANSFGEVNDLKFDKFGNMFVVDNTYELHENGRVIGFLKSDLDAISSLFPSTKAKRVYISKDFTSPVTDWSRLLNNPGPFSPVSIAFNSRGEMVLGHDGYPWLTELDRARTQLLLYRTPLTKNTPDSIITLPLGAPGEMLFDAQDNLVVQDATWNKVWVISYDLDPHWLKPF
ncbi:MAG TPA: hypothetical protein VK934_01930 [Fimbriimonas sp.]|nr:hypothetical protein [Fimbriimonas sp.]